MEVSKINTCPYDDIELSIVEVWGKDLRERVIKRAKFSSFVI